MSLTLAVVSCLLIRHGQTDWNKLGKLQGQSDHAQLTDDGERQAREVGEVLLNHPSLQGKTVEIWTSGLTRANKTAEIIAAALNLDPSSIQSDSRLKEANHGKFEGQIPEEYEKDEDYIRRSSLSAKERFSIAMDPINGEPYDKVAKRAREAIAEIATRNPETLKIFVSHGGVINALRKNITGRYEFPDVKNGEIVALQVSDGRFSLIEQD